MAHRMFQQKIGFDFSVLRAAQIDIERFIEQHLRHAAYVRGITPEDIYSVQLAPVGLLTTRNYVVAGPQNDDQGWDADGAPIAEYPGKSLPWAGSLEPTLENFEEAD